MSSIKMGMIEVGPQRWSPPSQFPATYTTAKARRASHAFKKIDQL